MDPGLPFLIINANLLAACQSFQATVTQDMRRAQEQHAFRLFLLLQLFFAKFWENGSI